MIRMLYLSQAAIGITKEQVKNILEVSQRNNTRLGVTGVLVHGGNLFVQVLEGPETTVLKQYVKIIDDRRHSDCRIIHISPANERMFQNWSMGNIESDPLEFQHVRGLLTHRLESVNSKEFAATMREFLKVLNSNPQ
ncbi:BLUF domain-containing protein [Methylocucumis oryzae]|uniref:Blue light sensor protein n=1 Tax=Methylocucumis oryzae TaxID=1632867 RepID=A0A0F3ILD2_9GAMM|nr:BLUF domain-containing protein [Methylocucumis oryzae]KJV06389.1 blue light sensor protein [Methylocucumis oryzae]